MISLDGLEEVCDGLFEVLDAVVDEFSELEVELNIEGELELEMNEVDDKLVGLELGKLHPASNKENKDTVIDFLFIFGNPPESSL